MEQSSLVKVDNLGFLKYECYSNESFYLFLSHIIAMNYKCCAK